MIPKIIHYCWLSDDPIPDKLKSCMDSWHKILPDYKFVLWDRNRFDINLIPWTKEAFENKKYAFAADYIRLFAVYHYGGIYMDMDVEVVRNLDGLLDKPYFFGLESSGGVEAGIFGAEKHNCYVKKCLDYYIDRSFILSNGKYDIRPLPSIMYELFSVNWLIKKRNDNNFIDSSQLIYLFPPDYLTAKSYQTGKICVTDNTYTIHHFAGSWVSKIDKFKGWSYEQIRKNSLLFLLYRMTYKKMKHIFCK